MECAGKAEKHSVSRRLKCGVSNPGLDPRKLSVIEWSATHDTVTINNRIRRMFHAVADAIAIDFNI